MGQESSSEIDMTNYTRYADALLSSDHWQGFGVDSSLQRFSGLDSTAKLNSYRDEVLYDVQLEDIGSAVERVGQALGGFTMVPNAVGLGALIISLILETVGKTMHKKTLGTAEMIERVFAKEKAREVRDLMEEYLKRLQINLGNRQLQLDSTRQVEADLSVQLTRLKNSMLKDGHMNTRSLKQWMNGAAFHTQMLIHEARLQRASGSRAIQAAMLYQQQIDVLLKKYKEYLGTAIEFYRYVPLCFDICFLDSYCVVAFSESESSSENPTGPASDYCVSKESKDKLVDAIFSEPRLTWANTYFSNLQANIPRLVRQNGNFYIRN